MVKNENQDMQTQRLSSKGNAQPKAVKVSGHSPVDAPQRPIANAEATCHGHSLKPGQGGATLRRVTGASHAIGSEIRVAVGSL